MPCSRTLTRLLPLLAVMFIATAFDPPELHSQTESDIDLSAEIVKLNRNVERIAAILERSVKGQRLELMIQRVGMGATRLAAAEQNLRSAKATRNTILDDKMEIEARLAQIAYDLDEGSLDMPVEDLERYTKEMDLQLELLEKRVRDADREIIELENEVMNHRASIRDWQDTIDRELASGN